MLLVSGGAALGDPTPPQPGELVADESDEVKTRVLVVVVAEQAPAICGPSLFGVISWNTDDSYFVCSSCEPREEEREKVNTLFI